MRHELIVATAGMLLIAAAPDGVAAGAQAQPGEVVAKVREAADLLAAHGPGALPVLRDRHARFTWKDTYVFVVDCDADEVLANPAFPERQGGDIKQHSDYNGKPYGLELCRTAQQPGGGWVEYVWLKPGGSQPMRKFSYVMSVPGRSYQVGAGIYDQTLQIEDVIAIAEMSE